MPSKLHLCGACYAPTQILPSKHRRLSFFHPIMQNFFFLGVFFQLEGTIIAPTSSKAWGTGLFQWLQFTKLVGITVQGSGTIDGRGSVWWQDSPYNPSIAGYESALSIIPLNNSIEENPTIPVIFYSSYLIISLSTSSFSVIQKPDPKCCFDKSVADKQFARWEHAEY